MNPKWTQYLNNDSEKEQEGFIYMEAIVRSVSDKVIKCGLLLNES